MDSTKSAADQWTEAAKAYDEFSSVRAGAGITAAKISPGELLLDVATGPGDLAILAANQGAEVTAIDFSKGMIDLLNDKVGKEGTSKVTAHVMDGQALAFQDSTFDIVHTSHGVTLFPDYKQGLQEMVRVAKSGGRVIVEGPKAGHGTYAPFNHVINAKFPEVHAARPAGSMAMGSIDGIKSELSEAGLSQIEVTEHATAFPLTDVEKTVQGAMLNPFFKAPLAQLHGQRRLDLFTEFCAALRALQLEDGSPGYYIKSLVAHGTKP